MRGKGFEALREEIATNPDRKPDVGESRLHETAGAIAVGARPFLIAFNVTLQTDDILIARRIARVVRERDGGLPFVKALGFDLQSRRIVQVSMNLTNYEQTSIARAFDAVREEATRLEIKVQGAEIVGLVPSAALDRDAAYFPLAGKLSRRPHSREFAAEVRLAAGQPSAYARAWPTEEINCWTALPPLFIIPAPLEDERPHTAADRRSVSIQVRSGVSIRRPQAVGTSFR